MKAPAALRSLLLLALGLSLSTCKKEKDPTPLERLPPPTTEGKNTWGCLVNGEAWTSSGIAYMRSDWTTPDGMSLRMSFSRRSVGLSFPDSTRSYSIPTGFHPIVKGDQYGAHASVRIVYDLYEGNGVVDGSCYLTRLDYQAGVVSGTFAFTIVNAKNDTLRVTDGRFDIGNMDR